MLFYEIPIGFVGSEEGFVGKRILNPKEIWHKDIVHISVGVALLQFLTQV